MTAMISLTENNGGTTQKFPFDINTTTERRNITNTSDNTGPILSQNTPRQMSLLSEVFVIFLGLNRSINSKWQLSDCATIAISARYGTYTYTVRNKCRQIVYNSFSIYMG